MANKPKLKAEDVGKAIIAASGNVAAVARQFGYSRQGIYNIIKKSPSLGGVLDDARETMIDNVESKLYSEALAGNVTAMIFFLKTQGKKRGYVERTEIGGPSGADGDPTPVSIEIVVPKP